MEENVALDTAKQKKFEKSIKGIKKIIKKATTDPNVELQDGKSKKRKRKERGLVYLSHIPHGFYEHAMTQYFKQFGVVTNARVIRSKRTGASRGCAFVEFRAPAVAQIVSETMNNYLMGKRLIKAVYIPPEKQRPRAMRKRWNSIHNPGAELRLKMKKAYNADKDDKGELRRAKKILANLSRTKEMLSEMGIKYDFFVPVDVPETLADKPGAAETAAAIEAKVKPTKIKEHLVSQKKVKKESEPVTEKKVATVKKETEITGSKKPQAKSNSGKIDTAVKKESKKEQNNKAKSTRKEQEAEAKSIKPLEDFLRIQEDSEDSEGSEQFDSDEFEKMLAGEDDAGSESEDGSLGCGDSDNEAESDPSDDESIEDVLPPKKNTSKLVQKTPQTQLQKKSDIRQKQQPQGKRKAAQKTAAAVTPKKPKFEKQVSQKSNTKQFKKKK